MFTKKWMTLIALVAMAAMILPACAPAPTPEVIVKEVPVEKRVVETVVVEKEVPVEKEVVKTVVVEKEVPKEVVVTATPAPPTRPNILRVNLHTGDIPTLDPSLSTDTSSVQIVDELTVGLTRLNEVTLELEPGMAESWDISADGMTYTFHLRHDVTFHDGKPVTAQDFKYSIERASDYH